MKNELLKEFDNESLISAVCLLIKTPLRSTEEVQTAIDSIIEEISTRDVKEVIVDIAKTINELLED